MIQACSMLYVKCAKKIVICEIDSVQLGNLLNDEERNTKEDQNRLIRQCELGPADPG